MAFTLQESAGDIHTFYRENTLANGWKYRIELRPRSYDENVTTGIVEPVPYLSAVEIPDGVIQEIKTTMGYDKRRIGMPTPHELTFTLNMGILEDVFTTLQSSSNGSDIAYGDELEGMYEYLQNNYIYKDVKLPNTSAAAWEYEFNPRISNMVLTNVFELSTDYGTGGDLVTYDYFTQRPSDELNTDMGDIANPMKLELLTWYKWALESVTWEHIYVPEKIYKDYNWFGDWVDTREEDVRHTWRGNWVNLALNWANPANPYPHEQIKFSYDGYTFYSKVKDLDTAISNLTGELYKNFIIKDSAAPLFVWLDLSGSHLFYKQNSLSQFSERVGTELSNEQLYFMSKAYSDHGYHGKRPVYDVDGVVHDIYNKQLTGGFLSGDDSDSFGGQWDSVYQYLQDLTEGELLTFQYQFETVATIDNTMILFVSAEQETRTETVDVNTLRETNLTERYERLISCSSSLAGLNETGMFTEYIQESGKSPTGNEYELPPAIFSNSPGIEWGSTSSAGRFLRVVCDNKVYSRGIFYLEEQTNLRVSTPAGEYSPVRCHSTNYITINPSLYFDDTTLSTGAMGQGQTVVGYDSKQHGKDYYFSAFPEHHKSITKEKADRQRNYGDSNNEISWNDIFQQINRYSGIGNSLAIMCLAMFSRPNQALLDSKATPFSFDLMSSRVGQHLTLSDTDGLYDSKKLDLTDTNLNELLYCESDWESCTNSVKIYLYGETDAEHYKNFDYINKAT